MWPHLDLNVTPLKEARKQGSKEGSKGGKEASISKQIRKEISKEGTNEASNEARKQARKQASKQVNKQGNKESREAKKDTRNGGGRQSGVFLTWSSIRDVVILITYISLLWFRNDSPPIPIPSNTWPLNLRWLHGDLEAPTLSFLTDCRKAVVPEETP